MRIGATIDYRKSNAIEKRWSPFNMSLAGHCYVHVFYFTLINLPGYEHSYHSRNTRRTDQHNSRPICVPSQSRGTTYVRLHICCSEPNIKERQLSFLRIRYSAGLANRCPLFSGQGNVGNYFIQETLWQIVPYFYYKFWFLVSQSGLPKMLFCENKFTMLQCCM